jgi:hypothetical protein
VQVALGIVKLGTASTIQSSDGMMVPLHLLHQLSNQSLLRGGGNDLVLVVSDSGAGTDEFVSHSNRVKFCSLLFRLLDN